MSDLNEARVLRPDISQLASHQDMDLFTSSIAAFASPLTSANEAMNVAVLYMAFARGLEEAGVLDASSMPNLRFDFRAVQYTVELSRLHRKDDLVRSDESISPNVEETQALASQPASNGQSKAAQAAGLVTWVSNALRHASFSVTEHTAAASTVQAASRAHSGDMRASDSRIACDRVLAALSSVQSSEVALEAAFINTSRAYHQLGVLYVAFAECLFSDGPIDRRVESTAFHRIAFPRLLEHIKQSLSDAPLISASGDAESASTQSRLEGALGISLSALRKRLERARKFFCLVDIFGTAGVLQLRPVISVVNVDKLSFQVLAEARYLVLRDEQARIATSVATGDRMDVDA